jgi:hypothetical protein
MRSTGFSMLAEAAVAAGSLATTAAAQASTGSTAPAVHSTVVPAQHHDVSAPLRSMHPTAPSASKRDTPWRKVPHPAAKSGTDTVRQTKAPSAHAPTLSQNFEGLGQGFSGPQGTFTIGGTPPDPNSAVGTTQVVEIVNTGFAVFSKTGTTLFGPANTNTLFSGFGGSCQSDNDGDAVVRFDTLANRWVISQFANVDAAAGGPFFECVAVSQTEDATGAYNRYSFQYSNMPDYPKLGVWPDAYYVTYNQFTSDTGPFVSANVCALDRAKMLTGAAATQQCFQPSSDFGALPPSDVDGTTPPPQASRTRWSRSAPPPPRSRRGSST